MKRYTLLFLSLLFLACGTKEDLNSTAYYNVLDISKKGNKEQIIGLQIDTIYIDSAVETSFIGDFWIANESVYFSDTYFNYIHQFSRNGDVIGKYVGKGNGPNEALGFHYTIPTSNDFKLLFGGNSSIYSFNKNWKKTSGYRINWDIQMSIPEILKNPDPSITGAYEFDYGIPEIFKTWDENHLAIAITASHPKFNGYFNTPLYYNHSRILALVNIETGKIDRLIGRRSPFYLSKENLPNFDHFNYEVASKEAFVNFWVDPFVYILDKKTGLATSKFGFPGRDMKANYPITKTYEMAGERVVDDMVNFGYYNYLKYSHNTKLLFRGYTKGEETNTDGLQIYKEYALIGDIDVPKGFKIIGAIGKEFFGSIQNKNTDEGRLKFLKIKFSYEN
ncbi:MAG: hypothetical protein JXR05_15155 [Flavobacteriaceae bacterium]